MTAVKDLTPAFTGGSLAVLCGFGSGLELGVILAVHLWDVGCVPVGARAACQLRPPPADALLRNTWGLYGGTGVTGTALTGLV